tara:strand:- start:1675 stop:2424 length:750 start_codon:yes stop_codon:yes gene_type:complete
MLRWLPERLRLPDFLGLGTQKGGTSTLQALLKTHPGVFLPTCKEVHYFSLHPERQRAWYASHYTSAGRKQKCGDITPYYLFHPEAPQRIRSLLPRIRMVVLLRDPVERCLSQVFHARRLGFEPLEPEAAIDAEIERLADGSAYSLQKHSYQARSRYLEQLDRYERLFPARQLLVLRSEDLFEQPDQIWLQLLQFLKLPIQPLPQPLPHQNRGKGEAKGVPTELRARLRRELAATAAGVRKRYGFGWDWA